LFSLSLFAMRVAASQDRLLLQPPVLRPFFEMMPSHVYNYVFREFHPEADWQTSGRELRNMGGPEHTSLLHCPRPTLFDATRTIAPWPEAP
jgi:hypothetical protein